jgi:hypothetical protein
LLSGFFFGFFLGDSRMEGLDGCRHLLGQQNAFAFWGILVDDLKHTPPIGLEHDQVARHLGLELVQHEARLAGSRHIG